MEKITAETAQLTDLTCTRKEVDLDALRDLRMKILLRPDISRIARTYDALGNETRLKILYLLSEAGELCVCDLSDVLGYSVSAISHQLKKLKDNRFVKTRKAPPTIFYSLSDHSFHNVLVNLVRLGGLND